ncbi:cytidine deaminase [Flavihumibacter petaseus]|uniref:Cytidine deaminase n=1 Tax=Flavihumibacter petaseus NBRC 106054 TaxID=1220578 RepID=A0A0E9N284_9BACT|nr:cytidine deaminase [Flavihumibacter petaseus]GAO43939.1 cytidine deaminase [Flavihumibacter petaseus NBRC 106054]
MQEHSYQFSYALYDSIDDLTEEDAWLLSEAREVTEHAYAPYSNFHVGAVAKLSNGEILAGSNQENASFPVGLCAERVLLASIASLFPKVPIESIALSYRSSLVDSDHPITPCGICRQSLQEYEKRVKHPIRLILGGMEGKVIIIPAASMLLPLSFSPEDMGNGR